MLSSYYYDDEDEEILEEDNTENGDSEDSANNRSGERSERGGYERRSSGGPRGGGRFRRGRKVCYFCSNKVDHIDYKDVDLLRRFQTDRGRIRPRRQSGTCARHQRKLASAIKRARHIALLPFVVDDTP